MSRTEPVDLAYLRELSTRLLAEGAPVDGMIVGAAAREIEYLRAELKEAQFASARWQRTAAARR